MKKILLFLLVAFLTQCSARKEFNGVAGKKTLKGTWKVANIEFYGTEGTYKAKLFDFADSACFNNSDWMFIPNNGSGKFSTTNANSQCDAATSRIHWTYFDTESLRYLQLKLVDDKNRPIDPQNRGYRIKITSLNASTMTTETDVTSEGRPFTVKMTFQKTSNNVKL